MNFLGRLWAQLRVRLIVFFAAIALITYLLSGLSVYQRLALRLPDVLGDELFRRGVELQSEIERALATGQTLSEATDRLQGIAGLGYGLRVFNADGRLVNQAIPGGLAADLATIPAVPQVQMGQAIITMADGRRYLSLAIPLTADERPAGTLTLLGSLAAIDGALNEIYPQLVTAVVFSLVAIGGAGVFIGSNISRVLGEIEVVAQSITQGEYDRRVRVSSADEVGRLAMTINAMAAQLASLSRAQAQFFSKVSHELRTPLTIVKGFAITLLRRDDLDDATRRQIDIINQQTDNLTRLVDDLLDLARRDVNQLTLTYEATDLAQVVADVGASYHVLAEERGTALAVSGTEEPLEANVDSQRVKQVLNILLDNAFKHAGDGDAIALELMGNGRRAHILVTDSGPGIAATNLPRIFERFYQGDSARGGMGLGLALAKELVEAHGGTIEAQNRREGGCRFTIVLPRQPGPPTGADGGESLL